MISKEVPKKRIVSFLTKRFPNLIAIYLFGSSVQGTPGLESDIDLAILPVQPLNPLERWNLAQDLANLLKREVDLVDLRKASTVMRMQVISSGQYLYESNRQERDRFEDYVFSSYARLNEERKEIIKKVQEQGTIYG